MILLNNLPSEYNTLASTIVQTLESSQLQYRPRIFSHPHGDGPSGHT
jgi:hypothetical protein